MRIGLESAGGNDGESYTDDDEIEEKVVKHDNTHAHHSHAEGGHSDMSKWDIIRKKSAAISVFDLKRLRLMENVHSITSSVHRDHMMTHFDIEHEILKRERRKLYKKEI